MKNSNFLSLLKLLITPLVLLAFGVILVFWPDSAAALLVKILGWVLIAAAAGLVVWAIAVQGGMVSKVLGAVIFGLAGIWMVTHPLGLAAWLGRLVGILLLVQGLQEILYIRSRRSSIFLSLLTALAGGVLIILPMTTSRLVFRGMGILILVLGVIMLLVRIRSWKGPHIDQDPNIVDAL